MRKSCPWEEGWEQEHKYHQKMRVRCTGNTMDPMVNTTLTLILGKRRSIWSNALQLFQDFGDIVTAITAHGCVKVLMNPAGGNVVVRGKAERPKCSGMVSTFRTQISTMTVHVLHGEPRFALNEYHGLLTSECQLHMCTSLDRAQANTTSMLRIIKNTRLLIPGHRTMRPWGPRKDNASIMAFISAVLLECALAPEKARWASVVTTGPNMIWILPWGDREITHHPARVSTSTTRVPPSA